MKKYIFYSLIFVTLFSCNKTLNFDDEGYANQLVLNSILLPDSAFSAITNKSTSILTYNQPGQAVDGSLDVYEDGTFLTHMTSSLGRFRAAGFKPKSGSAYRIVGTFNGQKIESETIVPLPAEVMSVDTSSNNNGDYSYNKDLNFKVKIKDSPGDDFYRIVITREYMVQFTSMDNNQKIRRIYTQFNGLASVLSGDPVFKSVYNNSGTEIFDIGPQNDYHIFPDDFFKGKEISIQVMVSYHQPTSAGYGGNKQIYDRFTVHVQRLSKDLYNYMKYLNLYDYYHDNPISEPVPVYSNIKNGAGIFAGYNDDARFTYEKIYIPFSMDTITIQKNSYGY